MTPKTKEDSKPYPVRIRADFMAEIQQTMATLAFESFGEFARVSMKEKIVRHQQEQTLAESNLTELLRRFEHSVKASTTPIDLKKITEDPGRYPKH